MDAGQNRRRRLRRSGKGGGGRRRRPQVKPSCSFAPPPPPSRASLGFAPVDNEPAVSRAFLLGFAAVVLLVLFGGSHNPLVLGLALVFPGLALLFGPPLRSLDRRIDLLILLLLLVSLGAFLPAWITRLPDWRASAETEYGIDFGGLRSVQPWISLESWLLLLGGLVWLYSAASWRINYSGRQRLMLWLSVALCFLAAVAVWGNLAMLRYPGAESATAFSFFPNRNQTASFFALGGVAAFGFGMEGLRTRRIVHLAGLLATCLCLVALVFGVSRAGVLLYFAGILLWLVLRLNRSKVSLALKLGLPFLLFVLSFFLISGQRTTERVVDLLGSPGAWAESFRATIYQDSFRMIADAPILGHGLGNFSAIFPQYRQESANYQQVLHPESDWFWLAAEGGLVATALALAAVILFLRLCRGGNQGRSAVGRVTALVAVMVFLVHGLVDVSGHRVGTVYFAILFAALALAPRAERPALMGPRFRRVVGLVLLLAGSLWFLSGLFALPMRSGVARELREIQAEEAIEALDYASAERALDGWLDIRPMDWRAYLRKGQVELASTGAIGEAAAEFRRARFFEPVLGIVSYHEGFAWLPHDAGRTVSAWRTALHREMQGKERAFELMLREARRRPALMERMAALSRLEPEFRMILLRGLRGEALMREISVELETDPGLRHLSPSERSDLLLHWVEHGDVAAAETFLEEQSHDLDRVWWVRAVLLKNQARFEEAIALIRESVRAEEIPEIQMDQRSTENLERTFMSGTRNVATGTALLRRLVEQEDYAKAVRVATRLTEVVNPPAYALYWRAELMFRLGDYIDSWYAFEDYLRQERLL